MPQISVQTSVDSLPTECTTLARLPVISATFSTPPSLSIKSSKKFGGKASSSTRFKSASLTSKLLQKCPRTGEIPSALYSIRLEDQDGRRLIAFCSSAVPFDLPSISVLNS